MVRDTASQTRRVAKQSEGLGYDGVIVGSGRRRRTHGRTARKQSEQSNVNRYENY
jgi:hypothetical protein